MAITYIANTDSGATTSPVSVAKPTGVVSGDKMIALVSDFTGSGIQTLGAPAGWTQIGSTQYDTNIGGITNAAYYKDDLGTAGPYSFTSTGTSVEVVVVGYRGCATGAVDASVYNVGASFASTTQTSNGLTPSQAGDLLVFMLAATTNNSPWTPAASYTTRVAGTNEQYWMDQINAPSGATGTVTATASSGLTYAAAVWMVALAPVLPTLLDPASISTVGINSKIPGIA